MTENIITEKQCTKCRALKPLAAFGNHQRTPDGRRAWCKDCEREYKHRYHRTEHGRRTSAAYASRWAKTPKGVACVYKYSRSGTRKAARKANYKRMVATPKGRQQIKEQKQRSFQRMYQRPEWRRRRLDRLLRASYGITIEDYERIADKQGSVCAICHNVSNFGRLTVDHDHQSGRVRGLLCRGCNAILGRWKDSPETAQRAVNYLRKHSQLRLVS